MMISSSKRNLLFQNFIFGFNVSFLGVSSNGFSHQNLHLRTPPDKRHQWHAHGRCVSEDSRFEIQAQLVGPKNLTSPRVEAFPQKKSRCTRRPRSPEPSLSPRVPTKRNEAHSSICVIFMPDLFHQWYQQYYSRSF